MPRNMFAGPFETGQDAYDRAYERQQGVTDRMTTNAAGRQLAAGDRAGAGQTFARGGQIAQARQMQGDQQAEEDRARETAQQETQQSEHTEDRAYAETKRKVETLKQLADGLREIPAGKRQAALAQAMPIFQQIGVDASQFGTLTEDHLTDDQLALFSGELEKQWQALNLGNAGLARFNNRTGATEIVREPDPPPVIIANGGIAVDRETGKTLARNAKTFAPPRARSGAGSTPGVPAGFVLD